MEDKEEAAPGMRDKEQAAQGMEDKEEAAQGMNNSGIICMNREVQYREVWLVEGWRQKCGVA